MFAVIALHYKFKNLAISRKNSRKKGMVFKPSFKCLKNKKINLSPAILKLETLLYQNIYILFHLKSYSQSDFDSQKKIGQRGKKNIPNINKIKIIFYYGSRALSNNRTFNLVSEWISIPLLSLICILYSSFVSCHYLKLSTIR